MGSSTKVRFTPCGLLTPLISLQNFDLHISHGHAKRVSPRQQKYDLGLLGVLLHVIGDAINNVGVMISASIIWAGKTERKYYADPAFSLAIAFMILGTSVPLSEFCSPTIFYEPVLTHPSQSSTAARSFCRPRHPGCTWRK